MGAPMCHQAAVHPSWKAGRERFIKSFNGKCRDECLNETPIPDHRAGAQCNRNLAA